MEARAPSALLLNQFFAPDESPTSVLLTDVARHLCSIGYSVTVICSRAHYCPSDARSSRLDVRVIRIPSYAFQRGASPSKVLSYLAFLVLAFWRAILLSRQDCVVCLTTPPLLSAVGYALKLFRGSALVIWEMDIYPDIAVDVGILRRDAALTRILRRVQRFLRSRADAVIALGECMRERLVLSGVCPDRIHVAENWADGTALKAARATDSRQLTILYSGNLGIAHETDTVFETIRAVQHDSRIQFIFAGGGPGRRAFAQACAEAALPNVRFRPYASRDRLAANLSECDIGLVTQKPDTYGSVVPSKVYSLIAVGRPVLYVGPAGSTVHRLIAKHRCGWHVRPGDFRGAVELLNTLAANRDQIRSAGSNARRAFESHYDLPQGVARIRSIVETALHRRLSVVPTRSESGVANG